MKYFSTINPVLGVLCVGLLAGSLGVVVAAPAHAHTIQAPVTVQADSDGNFYFEWTLLAGPGQAFVAGGAALGTENVDLSIIWDCFCVPQNCTLSEGEFFSYEVFGNLTDPTQAGVVRVGVLLCEGDDLANVDVPILPAATTGVGGETGKPQRLRVLPNPFRSRTAVEFTLASPASVRATIFDTTGRAVRGLVPTREYPAGSHTVTWDARSESGARLPAGIYFLKFSVADRNEVRKLVLLP